MRHRRALLLDGEPVRLSVAQQRGPGRSFRFTVVGAGGLGGPLVYALAAAGGRVTVIDDDVVELSNLQRQVQFTTADVGRAKVDAIAVEARRRGHDVRGVRARLEPATADALLGDADVVLDGTDSPDTKLLVGDWAVARARPHVIAGVLRWGGTVFAGAPGAACFRCLFEDAPAGDDAPTCADAGVIGAACAVVGGLAARAAISLASGVHDDAGSILVVEDLRRAWAPRRVRFARRPGCTSHPS